MEAVDRQTPANKLQLVTAEDAAALLAVPANTLRYSAWPQVVKTGKVSELVTGEAWIYAPTGRLDNKDPHPACVFHRGIILGTVEDLDGIGGFLSTERGRGKSTLKQEKRAVGSERRVAPDLGVKARVGQMA